MERLYNAEYVAGKIGVSSRTVRRAAARHDIGQFCSRGWVFFHADIEELRSVIPGKVGNPDFGRVGNPQREKTQSK